MTLGITNKDEKVPKRRRKVKISYIVIVLLLVIISGFLVFRFSLKSNLQSKLDVIRASGYPVTFAELDAWYTIPEFSENAADTIIEAFSYYYEWDRKYLKGLPVVSTAQLPARTEPIEEETKTLIVEYLADNGKALELLHKGAAIEHSRYPVDFSQGFSMLMPYLSDIRKGIKMLKLEGVLHAENTEPQLATDSVITIMNLARSLDKEPIIISQLVRIAFQGFALSTLERVLNRAELTDEQLIRIDRTLVNAQDRSTLSRAIAGERCFGISFFKGPVSQMTSFTGRPVRPRALMILYKASGLADTDAVIYLDLMTRYMDAVHLPLHERTKAAEAVEAELKKKSGIHIPLHTYMPALSRCVTIELRYIAGLQTARAALAIERYRLANGALPHTLEELTPGYLSVIPKDPFDEKDLRYKKLETGFVVYSIGEDGNDDGGKERPPREKSKSESSSYDITFIIQR